MDGEQAVPQYCQISEYCWVMHKQQTVSSQPQGMSRLGKCWNMTHPKHLDVLRGAVPIDLCLSPAENKKTILQVAGLYLKHLGVVGAMIPGWNTMEYPKMYEIITEVPIFLRLTPASYNGPTSVCDGLGESNWGNRRVKTTEVRNGPEIFMTA